MYAVVLKFLCFPNEYGGNMNTKEYAVQDLQESEMKNYNGGFLIFLTAVLIGIELNKLYHERYR
jgi:hypothetical protein